jgi:hypothetical protein
MNATAALRVSGARLPDILIVPGGGPRGLLPTVLPTFSVGGFVVDVVPQTP